MTHSRNLSCSASHGIPQALATLLAPSKFKFKRVTIKRCLNGHSFENINQGTNTKFQLILCRSINSMKSTKSITFTLRQRASIDFYLLIDKTDKVQFQFIDWYRFFKRFSDIDFYWLTSSGYLHRDHRQLRAIKLSLFLLTTQWPTRNGVEITRR